MFKIILDRCLEFNIVVNKMDFVLCFGNSCLFFIYKLLLNYLCKYYNKYWYGLLIFNVIWNVYCLINDIIVVY